MADDERCPHGVLKEEGFWCHQCEPVVVTTRKPTRIDTILTGASSGIEPVYDPTPYMRRSVVRINSEAPGCTTDMTEATRAPFRPRLMAELDRILSTYRKDEAETKMGDYSYDVLFRQGRFELRVSVYFMSKTFDIGQAPDVAVGEREAPVVRSSQDLNDSVTVLVRAQSFVAQLPGLGITER